jgi:uncharacterized membrane protein required for colicin V production
MYWIESNLDRVLGFIFKCLEGSLTCFVILYIENNTSFVVVVVIVIQFDWYLSIIDDKSAHLSLELLLFAIFV